MEDAVQPHKGGRRTGPADGGRRDRMWTQTI